MKNIILMFPGIRGDEIPLLYFAGKKYEDQGYEAVFMKPKDPMEEGITLEEHIEIMYEYWKQCIMEMNLTDYDHIIFAAKSMGTVCACRMKEALELDAELILFTPLYQTLPYMHAENEIKLVAAGTKDKWLPSKILEEHCIKNQIPYYIESGVGHRMEVQNDLARNLEVLQNVINRC